MKYTAMAALPAEQQDPEFNPSGGPLGWIVVTDAGTDDEQMVKLTVNYMAQSSAVLYARILNQHDNGKSVQDIALAEQLDVSYIEWVIALLPTY